MEIKGIKEGILISFGDQDWQHAKECLIEKIHQKQDFFHGAKLVLDVGNSILGTKVLEELRADLSKQNISLSGVLSHSMVTKEAAHKLGLITKLDKPENKPDQKLKPLGPILSGEPAIFIRKTMRSGYKIMHQGHVVVLGDVNPGAEIVASGSVIVWGHLRGTVHAGAEGDQSAVVCALDLSPTQLRIATKIAKTPEGPIPNSPEVASLSDDQIIAEPWQ